jgi:hypothetical protein
MNIRTCGEKKLMAATASEKAATNFQFRIIGNQLAGPVCACRRLDV